MKWFRSLTVAAVVVSLTLSAATAFGQEEKKPEGMAAGMAEDPMMELMQKYGTPGKEHAELAKMVGKWDAATTMWMAPDAEPVTSTGSVVITSVLGGRWFQQNYTGDMMGMPFTGIGYLGFDKFKNQYVSTWMDDMSTMTMISYGDASPDGKTITYSGVCDDIMTGTKNKVYKSVVHNVDDNTSIFEMYDKTPEGKEYKMMEIKYTRGK
ncbi:MAG: DUF1579 domain-containing protein [Candidatus Zixiibacteriota bacterium]